MQEQFARTSRGAAGGGGTGGSGKMVMDIMRAGGLVVAGTDTPNAFNLHGELTGLRHVGHDAV